MSKRPATSIEVEEDKKLMPPPPPRAPRAPPQFSLQPPSQSSSVYRFTLYKGIEHMNYLMTNKLINDELLYEYCNRVFPYRFVHINPKLYDMEKVVIGGIKFHNSSYTFRVFNKHEKTPQVFLCKVSEENDIMVCEKSWHLSKRPRKIDSD